MKMAYSIPLVAGLLVATVGCQHNLVQRFRGGCTDCQTSQVSSSSTSGVAHTASQLSPQGHSGTGQVQPAGAWHRITDGQPLAVHGHPAGCTTCAGGHGFHGGHAVHGGHGLLPGAHHGLPVRVAPLPHGYESYMSNPANGGPPGGTYGYPYYTTRGPRDFLLDNPPSIGY